MIFWRKSTFKPDRDIPSLEGKVILITGGNTGLGKQSAIEFARHNPRAIWLASRDISKAQAAADEIRLQAPNTAVHPLAMDLASFDSITKAAATFTAASDRLDILMLNAGVMAIPPGLTQDGYEVQFGTNHMGHALLAKLLLPLLLQTADARVVSLASHGHAYGKCQLSTVKTPAEQLGPYGRYSQSKLANVLWARQFAKEHRQITVASIHPGVVNSELMNKATETPLFVRSLVRLGGMFLATVEEGARNQLWASVSSDVRSGEYYEPVGVSGLASAAGQSDELAKELWDWTERELEGRGGL